MLKRELTTEELDALVALREACAPSKFGDLLSLIRSPLSGRMQRRFVAAITKINQAVWDIEHAREKGKPRS